MNEQYEAMHQARTAERHAIQERRQREVRKWADKGYHIASTLPDGTIIMERKVKVGTFWNLALTVATGGFWLIVVVIKIANRKIETKVVNP